MIKCFCLRQKPTKHTVNYASFFFSLPPTVTPVSQSHISGRLFQDEFFFYPIIFFLLFFFPLVSLTMFSFFFFHHTQAAVNEFKDRRALTLFAYFSRHSPIFLAIIKLNLRQFIIPWIHSLPLCRCCIFILYIC